jgi:hypothetical protein
VVILKRLLLTKNKVEYAYYPEGKEDYGIISFDLTTKEPALLKEDGKKSSSYKGQAFKRIKLYDSNNNFPETGLVAWY